MNTDDLARHFATEYTCPDCTARKQLVELAAGVLVLRVLHDATCPALLSAEKENER